MPEKIAAFFDRDDTLIMDVPYNGDPEQVELMPDAKRACEMLKEHGFELFIISNQSGVRRGKITESDVKAVNERILELFGKNIITQIYCCYDTPDDPPDCRKPSPKMIVQAAREHGINLEHSFMVGDKKSDITAGQNAGCRTILFYPPARQHRTNIQTTADYSSSNLISIAQWIINITDQISTAHEKTHAANGKV